MHQFITVRLPAYISLSPAERAARIDTELSQLSDEQIIKLAQPGGRRKAGAEPYLSTAISLSAYTHARLDELIVPPLSVSSLIRNILA